jgi:DNA-binding protein H-NS
MARRGSRLPDISQLTAEELVELIEVAHAEYAAKKEEAKRALLEEFRTRAAEAGLELAEITGKGRRKRSDAGKPAAVKFRGPKGETWSGRGRPPNWLVELEAKGKKRNDFAV